MIRKLYRSIRWRVNNYLQYLILKKEFSNEYASVCYRLEKEKRRNSNQDRVEQIQNEKDQLILNMFYQNFSDIIERYASDSFRFDLINKQIWTLWWTGEDSAPEIVKCCLNSLRENANGYEVTVLDSKTYSQYVKLP